MNPSIVTAAFGTFFVIGALLSIVNFTAVFRESARLTFERFRIDDGSERQPAVEAFELSRRSSLLSTLAGFAFGTLGALGVVIAVAGPVGQIIALALTVGTALAADELRTRHARLEKRFYALSQAHDQAVAPDSTSLA